MPHLLQQARAVAMIACACAMLSACDPPPAPSVADAPRPAVAAAAVDLPAPVSVMRDRLLDIAASGQPWDMARLADATPGFVSNSGGMRHRDYWYLKLRTGDWPMEQMSRVLGWRPAVEETADGRVYVWPYMARLGPGAITEPAARDIDALAGEGSAAAMRAGAPWPGYSLGVREDGVWLFFVSGAE